MSSVYSLYKELLPPTSIETCVEAQFTAPNAVNLIVSRGSLLQVYNVVEDDVADTEVVRQQLAKEKEEEEDQNLPFPKLKPIPEPQRCNHPRKVAKLELHAQFRLHGNVTSIGVVRTSTSVGLLGMDSLLLSFKDAKMSLIEYSAATHNIVTVSIHYYEREEFKKESVTNKFKPEIRIDPENRCAVLRFYNDRLAILPFKQDTGVQVNDADDTSSKYPFHSSFVIPFSAIDSKVRNVVDVAFLYGFFEPTLAILYEPIQTWTGRLAARKDTKSLIVVSLDITQRSYPVLFKVDHLPYNATSLIPVPPPVGGLVVLSPNALIHVDQTSVPGVACAVNSYYGMESNFPAPPSMESIGHSFETKNPLYDSAHFSDHKSLGISLEACVPYFLNPDTLLLVLRSGELVLVDMEGGEDVGRGWKRRKGGVKSFNVTRVGLRTIMPSCGTRIGNVDAQGRPLIRVLKNFREIGGTFENDDGVSNFGYLFVGSRVADAMLIQFTEADVVANEEDDDAVSISPEPSGEETGIAASMELAIDEDIFGVSPQQLAVTSSSSTTRTKSASTRSPKSRYTFRICDSLICTGPIKDLVVGEPTQYSSHAFSPDNPRTSLEVVTCAGEGFSGALGILQRNIRPQIISTFEMPGITDVWSVRCTSVNEQRRESVDVADASLIEKLETVEENGAPVVKEAFDKFLVLSKEDQTMILETGEEFAEVEGKGFFREGPTVGVGSLLDETATVQVHPRGIIVLDSDGTRTQEIPISEDDRWIVACSIVDPYVLVLMNVGEVMLFVMDPHTRDLQMCQELKDIGITAACLYCDDTSGSLLPTISEAAKSVTAAAKATPVSQYNPVAKLKLPKKKTKKRKRVAEDLNSGLDLDLYGEHDDIYGAEIADDSESEAEGNVEEKTVVQEDGMQLDANGDTFRRDDTPDQAPEPAEVNEENVSRVDEDGQPSVPERRIWCIVFREDGALEIFRVPDFEQCYFVPQFDLLPSLIYDHPHVDPHGNGQSRRPAVKFEEILMINLGRDKKHKHPYFISRTEESDLIIYKAFLHIPDDDIETPATALGNALATPNPSNTHSRDVLYSSRSHRLAIRFVRVSHDHISREPKLYADTEGDKLHPVHQYPEKSSTRRRRYLKPFNKIGLEGSLMYSGVFMSGPRPCWIMVAETGGVGPQFDVVQGLQAVLEPPMAVSGKNVVRVHPQMVDGEVVGFTRLHNVNVPHGFLYVTRQGSMRICQLPAHFTYDADWPYCKVPLRRTPQKLTYHHTSQTYVMATSVPVPFVLSKAQHAAAVAAGVIEAGDELPESEHTKRNFGVKDEDRDAGMYWPQVSSYSMELVSPVTWETVDVVTMDEYEHILAIQAIELESKQTTSGRKLFIAVGTGTVRGEDLATRGRIFIYDIIDIVPEPDNPQTNHRFKQLFVNEEKGPVTALCNVGGYLLAAIGTKIIIHTFDDSESLTGVAFIDVNMYVNSVCAIKNLILVGDIMKSVWFLGFQEEPPKLALLGKDYHSLNVYGCEFMVDDSSLAFIVGDGESNVHVMTYSPYHIQSSSGQKLIRRGDFHAGQHVSKIVRLQRMSSSRKGSNTIPRQQVCLTGTLEGGLALLLPVSEKLYKRLYGLYSKMVNNLQHPAGLNPRGFRQVPLQSRPTTAATATPMTGPPGPRLVLDGELLYQYACLSVSQQKELAKGIGSVSERILDDLLEGVSGVDYF
ncbi:cleavage/polyadenylation factor CFT1 [Spizellomyces punctatus DAOM BR117]|uniref:Cleavage and polyadenylation specificity factor subunit 1 n=1 Tax=Spizellomyces punctatus (strain DAOM BR117) TaxID=645134 RepID=A0A0L0HAP2_SPIPD|nr:cleavage/polyadenylation factor CFT1 [Spizellomyces punctatus DAOM BR117]KNC97783.1 hypothetical protein SPPG_06780 [Spizellomyces punctatus DAOM BR117]|eukprot:XP_016605823.1 hypothetical protein SPPG_06780 [Spizellomyces punctatus DAOM BR117]